MWDASIEVAMAGGHVGRPLAPIWRHFERLEQRDTEPPTILARCLYCSGDNSHAKNVLVPGRPRSLRRHLNVCDHFVAMHGAQERAERENGATVVTSAAMTEEASDRQATRPSELLRVGGMVDAGDQSDVLVETRSNASEQQDTNATEDPTKNVVSEEDAAEDDASALLDVSVRRKTTIERRGAGRPLAPIWRHFERIEDGSTDPPSIFARCRYCSAAGSNDLISGRPRSLRRHLTYCVYFLSQHSDEALALATQTDIFDCAPAPMASFQPSHSDAAVFRHRSIMPASPESDQGVGRKRKTACDENVSKRPKTNLRTEQTLESTEAPAPLSDLTRSLVHMIQAHSLPLAFVEHPTTLAFLRCINPSITEALPTANQLELLLNANAVVTHAATRPV